MVNKKLYLLLVLTSTISLKAPWGFKFGRSEGALPSTQPDVEVAGGGRHDLMGAALQDMFGGARYVQPAQPHDEEHERVVHALTQAESAAPAVPHFAVAAHKVIAALREKDSEVYKKLAAHLTEKTRSGGAAGVGVAQEAVPPAAPMLPRRNPAATGADVASGSSDDDSTDSQLSEQSVHDLKALEDPAQLVTAVQKLIGHQTMTDLHAESSKRQAELEIVRDKHGRYKARAKCGGVIVCLGALLAPAATALATYIATQGGQCPTV